MTTRCRWCGQWLLPVRNGGDGEPYCNDTCCTASLERAYDQPSTVELEPTTDRHIITEAS